MIPEIGHFALIIALTVSMVVGVVPLLGAWRGVPEWMALAVPATRALFLFVLIAYLCLTYAFVSKDFSVAYVAQNANAELPIFYRISAVWGAHEGSILLWTLILAVWSVAVSVASGTLPVDLLIEPDDVPLEGMLEASERCAEGELAAKVMVVPKLSAV